MDEQGAVIDLLNGLLGVYWTSYAQHQTHVALVDSWGIVGLARGMQAHIDDEPETIKSVLDRLLDLGGRPAFTLGATNIGHSLREVLENDLELQRMARPGLNAAAEAAAGAHDATTRILLEGVLADEEEHLSWLETELELLEKMGEQLYLSNRLAASPPGPAPAA
jgi:bacterioferritin